MKTLQNNFTTPEQSKRLLGLGVPADSADCVLENLDTAENNFQSKQLELGRKPENCTYIELIIASFELAEDDGLIYFSKLEG